MILSAVNLEKIYQSAQKFVKSFQIPIKMTLSRQSKKWILIGVVILGLCYLVLHSSGKKDENSSNQDCPECSKSENSPNVIASRKTINKAPNGKVYEYDRDSPIIFIGGVPRSGTDFSKSQLNASLMQAGFLA